MGQITATRNLVATKVVRHAGQLHDASGRLSKIYHIGTRIQLSTQELLMKWGSERYLLITCLSMVTQICVSDLGHHYFRQWLVAFTVPSFCWSQFLLVGNRTIRNKHQWNQSKHFFSTNAFENIVCKMSTILLIHRCVNWNRTLTLYGFPHS